MHTNKRESVRGWHIEELWRRKKRWERTEELPCEWKPQQVLATTLATATPSSCRLSYANAGISACQCNSHNNVCACTHCVHACLFPQPVRSHMAVTIRVIGQKTTTETLKCMHTCANYNGHVKLLSSSLWCCNIDVKWYTAFCACVECMVPVGNKFDEKNKNKNKRNPKPTIVCRSQSQKPDVRQQLILLMMSRNYWFFSSKFTQKPRCLWGVTCLAIQRMQTQNNSLPELIPQTLCRDCKCLITH